jgi:alkylation response protein AidB-like acyl-CoA dehydrogenase
MDFSEPETWTSIRREAEAFVAENVTDDTIIEELRNGDGVSRPLMRVMGERGWIAPAWPMAEGGAGLDAFQAGIIYDTIRQTGGPTIGPGTTMLAANAIRALGSEALKAEILPGVTRGATLICLGYTEPEGGSDVFACKTKAIRDGDDWVINGQKMFTTFAHLADYCFLLTRTDPGSRGPNGITMFLVPMTTPGIEIRAVRTMGYERTNVVYYSDVRVKDSCRVGDANGGLAVMRAALEAEQNVAQAARTGQLSKVAETWARQTAGVTGEPLINDPVVRERLARLAIDAEVADLLRLRVSFLEQIGGKPGPHAALFGSETYVAWSAEMMDVAGLEATVEWSDPEAIAGGSFEWHYRCAVAGTIYGGSSEVLRSLIAEQSLGLPRSRPKPERSPN